MLQQFVCVPMKVLFDPAVGRLGWLAQTVFFRAFAAQNEVGRFPADPSLLCALCMGATPLVNHTDQLRAGLVEIEAARLIAPVTTADGAAMYQIRADLVFVPKARRSVKAATGPPGAALQLELTTGLVGMPPPAQTRRDETEEKRSDETASASAITLGQAVRRSLEESQTRAQSSGKDSEKKSEGRSGEVEFRRLLQEIDPREAVENGGIWITVFREEPAKWQWAMEELRTQRSLGRRPKKTWGAWLNFFGEEYDRKTHKTAGPS